MGVEIAALGTSPLPVDPSLTPSRRYERMAERFGLTVKEQLTCGCHVHVAVDSDDEGVAVVDRVRPWLAPLLAVSANSPFWQGRDSKYASFRSQVWARQPSAGPTELFGSARAYRETMQAVIDSEVLLDPGMIYFDARLSERYPTVEVRVADVCLDADDAVLVAAVCRALVETAVREWRAGRPAGQIRTELLRLAMWRAGRSGPGCGVDRSVEESACACWGRAGRIACARASCSRGRRRAGCGGRAARPAGSAGYRVADPAGGVRADGSARGCGGRRCAPHTRLTSATGSVRVAT